uniref:Uncharacterized protein n=1 Tax=Anguilla anguilla TaxID=7936 RepID=A0A0E9XVU8_ANGAN
MPVISLFFEISATASTWYNMVSALFMPSPFQVPRLLL